MRGKRIAKEDFEQTIRQHPGSGFRYADVGGHLQLGKASGQKEPSAEIAKLSKYYEDGVSIPWVNIHQLPEHASFDHKRHVKAGVACQTCHGPIQTMPVVYPVVKLNMGFCVDCHKANRENVKTPTSLDCVVCHK